MRPVRDRLDAITVVALDGIRDRHHVEWLGEIGGTDSPWNWNFTYASDGHGPRALGDHARRDLCNRQLIGCDGEVHSYERLVEEISTMVLEQLNLAEYRSKHERAQFVLNLLAQQLRDSRPDVVIVVRDGQNELFGPEGIPAIGIFTASIARDVPTSSEGPVSLSEGMRRSRWASHSEPGYEHQVHSGLAQHLTERLSGDDFDVTRVNRQNPGTSIGHAFHFVRYRLLGLDRAIPFAPILTQYLYFAKCVLAIALLPPWAIDQAGG